MVRSKEVPKKPKDPLMMTPPPSSKLRRFFQDDGGGGAAMSPAAAASVPNYMRGTSSSDAKLGHRPPSSASPMAMRRRPVRVVTPRGKVLFPSKEPALGRATCSSAMKDAKFPAALDLAPGATDAAGPAATRVCPYTYCSLNGHHHSPAVPLRSFLASRRRLIKTQQSMKLKGVSAFRRSPRPEGKTNGGGGAPPLMTDEEEAAAGDCFVEVYAGPRVSTSTDMSCSDMSLDEMDAAVRRMEFVVFDRCGAGGAERSDEKGNGDLDVCGDGDARIKERFGVFRNGDSSECSEASISGEFVEELPWMRYQGYEDDSLDGEFSDEHRIGDEEITGAVVPEDQEGQDEDEEGTSGRLGDEAPEWEDHAAQEHESNDEQIISDFVRELEITAKHEGVDFSVEACEDQEGFSENNILDTAHRSEVCAEEEIQEEENSAAICRLEIPEQEVAENIPDESCKEEASVEQEEGGDGTNMEFATISEVTKEPNLEDEENMQDDGGSEMEISEVTSGFGYEEDFSEEVTSKDISKGEISDYSEMHNQPVENRAFEQDNSSTEDNSFHQDGSTSHRSFDQDDISAGGHDDSQKGLDILMGEFRVISEEAGIHETNHDDPVDCTEDVHKESDISLSDLQDASEGSGIAQENSQGGNWTCLNDEAQMIPDIITQTLEDVSKDGAQETTCDDNSTPLAACAQMEFGIGISELREGSSDVTEEPGSAQKTCQDDNAEYFSDGDSQRDTVITTCQLQVASEENVIAQEGDAKPTSTGVRDGAQNESEQTCELAASEECHITQETNEIHVALEESMVITSESEGESEDTNEESDIAQDDHGEDYSVGINVSAQKEVELDTCESGGASEGTAVQQEDDGHVNTIDLNDSAQKDITVSILDSAEELLITEETNHSSTVVIPELSDNFSTAEGQEEPQNQETVAKESSLDDICNAFSGMHLKGNVYLDPTESISSPRNRLIIARRRRTPEEEEYLRGFNPRAPNFLPLELDPEAEKVDLKHQMMDDRKNAEEWMIDYALRRVVNNLGPARKKKVELLVQAFETVLPHDEEEKKSITPTRSVQACN
uniref:Calmodulin-binding domain-containing protein n=1 Tax=Leersia perrieri TaxID=77586 RepID=A0A0D9WFY3_9ORYZ